jgi:hypothetical protein
VRFGFGRLPGTAATAGKRVLRAGRRSEMSCGGLTRNQRRSAGLAQIDPPEDLACALCLPRSASPLPPPWHRLRPNPNKSNRPTLSTALAALCCLMTIRGNFSRRAGPARSTLAAAARRRLVLKGSPRLACRLRPTVHQRASLIRSNATQNRPMSRGADRSRKNRNPVGRSLT